jgi:hypothetical protein
MAQVWIATGISLGIAAPISIGCIEYFFFERGLDIVISPREWLVNPAWPQEGPRYLLGEKRVDFAPRMQQYTKVAEIMITLSSASLVFIPSHLTRSPSLAFPLMLLGFAVLWGVCFIAWMSYCYETALYSPHNFGAKSSSTTFGLGFGALFCFAIAYLVLAIIVAKGFVH